MRRPFGKGSLRVGGALCATVLFAALTLRAASGQVAFEEGWKWYLHRRSQNAPGEELLDILSTLKKKYTGTGVDISQVDREMGRYAPPSSAAPEDGFVDGWKWYEHRKAAGAAPKELVDILETLKKKYEGSGMDLSRVERELAYYHFERSVVKPADGASTEKDEPLSVPAAPARRPSAPPSAVSEWEQKDLSPDEALLRRCAADAASNDTTRRLKAVQELKGVRDPRAVDIL
ncbi:MAG TPA: hypothetical protein P5079_09390, partial [Elusimicrobiota bacterium]|nr:hypothetical protein [Elusimicrobiota bacterium]